jgi:hypothetical protein
VRRACRFARGASVGNPTGVLYWPFAFGNHLDSMNSLPKFSGPDLDSSFEFTHPNVWQREEHSGWSRLVIGAKEREIPLMLNLCRSSAGPFGVLYVQLVFDNHNMIYAYGDLDRYESELQARGFRRGSVAIPTPHSHHYHAEFDQSEDELIAYWDWKKFPLEPDDDP